MPDRRTPRNVPRIVRVPQMSGASVLQSHIEMARHTLLVMGAGMSVGAVCEMQREIANLESMLKYERPGRAK